MLEKITIALVLMIALIAGCVETQVSDTPNHQALAYTLGKGMGIAVNKVVPTIDKDLSRGWMDMMTRNTANELVPPEEMLIFFNGCIGLISTQVSDPYGIIGDLGAMLMIYGAQFNPDGELIAIQPIPMSVLRFFEMGYKSGRMVTMQLDKSTQ